MRPHLALLVILLLTYASVSSYSTAGDRLALKASSSQNNGSRDEPAELADDGVFEPMLPVVLALRFATDTCSFSLMRIDTISDRQKFSSFSRRSILLI